MLRLRQAREREFNILYNLLHICKLKSADCRMHDILKMCWVFLENVGTDVVMFPLFNYFGDLIRTFIYHF